MNWRNGNAKSLSPVFLLLWFFGDAGNLIGAILTQQLRTQIYTAVYFVMMDCVLFLQYCYYTLLRRDPLLAEYDEAAAVAGVPSVRLENGPADPLLRRPVMLPHSRRWWSGRRVYRMAGWVAFITVSGSIIVVLAGLLGRRPDLLDGDEDAPVTMADTLARVGYAVGWVSAALYLASRVPQIRKNWHRRSVAGLSPVMFLMAFMGNLTYSLAILLMGVSIPLATGVTDLAAVGTRADFFAAKLPWLVGSLGTVGFDMIV